MWALREQIEDKWYLHRAKILDSMSFPVLLSLNVALLKGKEKEMERAIDGQCRG